MVTRIEMIRYRRRQMWHAVLRRDWYWARYHRDTIRWLRAIDREVRRRGVV